MMNLAPESTWDRCVLFVLSPRADSAGPVGANVPWRAQLWVQEWIILTLLFIIYLKAGKDQY